MLDFLGFPQSPCLKSKTATAHIKIIKGVELWNTLKKLKQAELVLK